MLYLWIALFGLVGIFARFGLQALLQQPGGTGFPWGTLLVNVTGSLLVGFIARAGTGVSGISPELRIGLMVGLCGGYTTFSGYSLEIVRMLQEGAWLRGTVYAASSVLVSLAATALGMQAAAKIL